MNILKKFEPTAYAALRIVFGFLFACHGAQKCFGVLGGHRPSDVLGWTGAGIELVGGVLILIGLLTHLAAFRGQRRNGSGLFHGASAARASCQLRTGGELAVIYCFVALFIACRGAGKWGVDKG